MKTETQITAEIYNALTTNATLVSLISTRTYWIGRPTVNNTFPLITYAKVDTSSDYAFGLSVQSEDVVIQIDVYTDPTEISQMDNIVQAVKGVMHGLCYRLISASPQFVETDISKIMRALRWERINV